VLDPWGNAAQVGGEPVSVRVAGEESARFKNIVRELRRQNADKVLDEDERADVALSIVVGCTIGWDNVLGADGNAACADTRVRARILGESLAL